MDIVGLGALNVDMVYEVDLASFGLEAGRERIGSYEEFKGLLKLLKNRGKLRAKSGGGSAANTGDWISLTYIFNQGGSVLDYNGGSLLLYN